MKKKNLFAAGFAFGLLLSMQSGCAETGVLTQPTAKPETIKPPAVEPTQAQSISGKVVETIDSGGYTYVNIEKDGKTIWVALPPTKVKTGEEIEVWSGTQMGKFTSKTLKKTFEEIIFSPGLVPKTNAKLSTDNQPVAVKPDAAQDQPAKAASQQQKGHNTMAQMTAISGKVVETMDSGGYTYVNLENEGKKVWAAMPATPVKVGQQLTLKPGAKMDNFTSKSLNRTFDSVIFSGGIISEPK